MGDKAKWTEDLIVNLLTFMLGNHDEYLKAKRNQKIAEFHQKASDAIGLGHPGKKVDDFLKNVGKEYRQLLVENSKSGGATEDVNMKLRGSEMVFKLYEEYQAVYYPKGSAVRPQLLVTPGRIINQPLQTTSAAAAVAVPSCSFTGTDGNTVDDGTFTPVQSFLSCFPGSSQSTETTRVARELVFSAQGSRKRPAPATCTSSRDEASNGNISTAPKLTRNTFLETSVDYQQQYLERVDKQNSILSKLLDEVHLFRTVYQVAHGIDLQETVTVDNDNQQ